MVRLGRHVRFSINPFLDTDSPGYNSYASKPAGEGLALYFDLAVELTGPVTPETGLLVNVSDIDKAIRRYAVPVLSRRIREHLRHGEHMPLSVVAQILRTIDERLHDKFPSARLDRFALQLNPFRTLAMDTRESDMMYFSEKFEFAATHKLWNEALSEEDNFAIFGKCANPTGHGHNYTVEVTVKTPAGGPPLRIGEFERTVDAHLMELLDHKNLNADVPEFRERIATVENLAAFAWERLAGRFDAGRLHCVTIWESDRTYCCYYGPGGTSG